MFETNHLINTLEIAILYSRGDHMKKMVLYGYILLLSYTLYHLLFNSQNGSFINDLLQNKADPTLFMVFNLLGLFPLAFILFGLKYLNMNKFTWGFLGLGFMLGGFALAVPFIGGELKPKAVSKKVNIIALIGLIVSILVVGYGLILGDFSQYYDAFITDSFVHIMTIDWIFLYSLSVFLSYKVYKKPYIAFIPVIGFYYLIFQDID